MNENPWSSNFVPEVVRRYMKNDLGEKNDNEAFACDKWKESST